MSWRISRRDNDDVLVFWWANSGLEKIFFPLFKTEVRSGEMSVRDEVAQLGDRYREAILKELHVFYREELRLNDYATRLGELMMLLPVFEVSIT